MKKLLITLFAIAVLLGLTGCKEPEPETIDFDILGAWEFETYSSDDSDTMFSHTDYTYRLTFNKDNTFTLENAYDYLNGDNNNTWKNQGYSSVSFKGTYSYTDNKIKLNFDQDKQSESNGLFWTDIPDYFDWSWYSGWVLKVEDNKLSVTIHNKQDNDGNNTLDPQTFVMRKAITKDENIIGLWADDDDQSRLLLNSDMTFEFSHLKKGAPEYAKGTYYIYTNTNTGKSYLYAFPEEESDDYINWTKILDNINSDFTEYKLIIQKNHACSAYELKNDSILFITDEFSDTYELETLKYSKSSAKNVKL